MAANKSHQFYTQGPVAPLGGQIQQRYDADPRRRMEQELMAQGSSTAPVYTNLQGLARALQGGIGGLMEGHSRKKKEEELAKYQADLSKVLAAGVAAPATGQGLNTAAQGASASGQSYSGPKGVVGAPAKPGGITPMMQALTQTGNPNLAGYGQQLAMQQIQQQQAAQAQQAQQAYDAQQAALKQRNAIALKQAPGAANTSRPSSPIQNFAERQRLVGVHGENSPEVNRFDNYVRAAQIQNTGSQIVQVNPADPTNPIVVAPTTPKPEQMPDFKAEVAAAEGAAKGEATAAVDKVERDRKNTIALDTFNIGLSSLGSALKKTDTGPVVGNIPAMSPEAQVAEGAISMMGPLLKDTFRGAGEGTFTDADQRLLMGMVPTRKDHPEARIAKIEMIKSIVASKLNMPKNPVQIGGSVSGEIPPPPPPPGFE